MAGKDIVPDIANNLEVSSLQNSNQYSTNSDNMSIGIGLDGKWTPTNISDASYGKGHSYTDREWVDNQTSIIGHDSVTINVGTKENSEGNTNIIGAIIANLDKETGEDKGNLALNTNTLTYQDIKDHNYSKTQESGVGIGSHIKVNYKDSGIEQEQDTKATIGHGSITIANKENSGILDSLNREAADSQIITKNEKTGGYDFDIDINMAAVEGIWSKGIDSYSQDQWNQAKLNVLKTEAVVKSIYEGVSRTLDKIKDPEEKAELLADVAFMYKINKMGLPVYNQSPTKEEKKK